MTTEKIDWKSCTVDTTELTGVLGMLTDRLVRGDLYYDSPELKTLNTMAMCTIAIALNDISNTLEDINVGGIAAHVYKGE